MTNAQDRLGKTLDELTQQVYMGKVHFNVWRELTNELACKPSVVKTARTFFALTLRSHMELSLLHAARLFDKHRSAVTLNSMLELAMTRVSSKLVSDARSTLMGKAPLISRLKLRRDKVMAHLDPRAVFEPEAVHEESKMLIKELDSLYEVAGEIINTISLEHRGSASVMELLDWDDFKNAIRLIEKGKKAEIEDYEREFGPFPGSE